MIEKAKSFKPKKFKSNTDNFIKIVEDYIEETDNVSWYNKYKEGLLYLFFGGCTTLINIVIFWLLRLLKIEVYVSNGIAWLVAVFFAFFTNKLFVFESKEGGFKKSLKECVSFIAFRLVSLLFDMGIMYLLIDVLSANEMVSKIIANIFVIIINYVFSKLFIFRKKEVD
ncbi:MAG: GtrA family protein [Bacilli bacterium]|nr:GtrA family protein [Bacilli bacterium]